MSVKIQGRAIERCGLLLKAMVPDAHPGQPKKTVENAGEKNWVGGQPILSLAQAARDAGLSPWKQKKALAVASIPKATLENMGEKNWVAGEPILSLTQAAKACV